MQLQPGTLVLRGKYRIERLLGEGASAEVYLVALTRGQGQRALKILRRDLPGVGSTKIRDYRTRFEREYDLQQQLLGNPRIIQAYDADDEGGSPALVMEYAAGGSLQDELDALARRGERATPARCAEVLQDIALGLQAMHERGWVHRDVKPRNVLFERAGGRSKLGDLGVAQTDQTRTRTDGQAWEHPGTPPYCSPEHATGLAYLTPAADVYALGVIGYRMLTGLVLAPATADQAPAVIDGPAPEWLNALIRRMLAWDYRERPQHGGAVAEEIARGLVAERERAAVRDARARALQAQVAEALKSRDFARADAAVDELLRLIPGDPEALRLERRVSLAIVEEKRRIGAAEAKLNSDAEAKRIADEQAVKRRADEAAVRKAADEAERLQATAEAKRENAERLRREQEGAAAAEQKPEAEEAVRLRLDVEQRQWASAQVQAVAEQIEVSVLSAENSSSSQLVAPESTLLDSLGPATRAPPGIASRLALPVAGLVGICLCLSLLVVLSTVLTTGGLTMGFPLDPTREPTPVSVTSAANANPPTPAVTLIPTAARATPTVSAAPPSETVGAIYTVTPGPIIVLPQVSSIGPTGTLASTGSPVFSRSLQMTDPLSASGLGTATLDVTATIPLTGSITPILPSITVTRPLISILPGNSITGSLFDGLMTCASLTDGKCAYHETSFARGIRRVYVTWNGLLPVGTVLRVDWLLNGRVRADSGDRCVVTEEGCNPYVSRNSAINSFVAPIPSGVWTYRFYVGDELLAEGYLAIR